MNQALCPKLDQMLAQLEIDGLPPIVNAGIRAMPARDRGRAIVGLHLARTQIFPEIVAQNSAEVTDSARMLGKCGPVFFEGEIRSMTRLAVLLTRIENAALGAAPVAAEVRP